MAYALLAILVILALLGGMAMAIYNRLVRSSNECKRSLAQIDVQLKRRYDLIPNLVESARGYLAHESSTLEEVTKARNSAAQLREAAAGQPQNAQSIESLFAADTALTGVLGRLMMVSESYPQLKADGTVADLMTELNNTETQISGTRAIYNNAVKDYNQTIELFPNILLAGFFGFKRAASWALADPTEAAPVRFTLTSRP
ncbi:MAG: LemA family protein [Deltaproteobacteria bacterium]|jgi:LemA protein|nr:LemA family protein [Deltaproteobacteria bacterium]